MPDMLKLYPGKESSRLTEWALGNPPLYGDPNWGVALRWVAGKAAEGSTALWEWITSLETNFIEGLDGIGIDEAWLSNLGEMTKPHTTLDGVILNKTSWHEALVPPDYDRGGLQYVSRYKMAFSMIKLLAFYGITRYTIGSEKARSRVVNSMSFLADLSELGNKRRQRKMIKHMSEGFDEMRETLAMLESQGSLFNGIDTESMEMLGKMALSLSTNNKVTMKQAVNYSSSKVI